MFSTLFGPPAGEKSFPEFMRPAEILLEGIEV
jgi:hypothetical protein